MIPDGIHFCLPHEAHIADDALGGGDHKLLAKAAPGWWWKSRHSAAFKADLGWEDKTEEESLSRLFGSALHTRVLEGRAKFDTMYWPKPPRPDGLMETKDELLDGLELAGVEVWKQLNHTDLVLKARMHARELAAHNLGLAEDWKVAIDIERAGRTEISNRWGVTFDMIDHMLDAPRASYDGKSQRQHALTNGMPEVSVFWTDELGVRCKCRFDWMRIGSITDLKSYAAREDESPVAAFLNSTSKFAYDMQASLYLEAREQMPRLFLEGRTFGDFDPAWLNRVVTRDKPPAWVWLAVQTMGLPQTDLLNLTSGLISGAAKYQVLQARTRYQEYVSRYGLAGPWIEDNGMIDLGDEVFEAAGLARRMTGRADEPWKGYA